MGEQGWPGLGVPRLGALRGNDALCDLRHSPEVEDEKFWIDQICINQLDDVEKGRQVSMMSQIYSMASRVITYLGPTVNQEEEDKGIRLLVRIHESIPRGGLHSVANGGYLNIQTRLFEGSLDLGKLPPDLDVLKEELYTEEAIVARRREQGWDWLIKAAYGEWAERKWILQEQLLNVHVVFLSGHYTHPWSAIITIPILFAVGHLPSRFISDGRTEEEERALTWIGSTLYGMWKVKHNMLENHEQNRYYFPYTLLENMLWHRTLLCRDPQDVVYALLAISADTEYLGIVPDYPTSNTTDALSHQVSVHILSRSRNLDLLSAAIEWRNKAATIPSWCLGIDYLNGFVRPDTTTFGAYKIHPKQREKYVPRFESADRILLVHGRVLDTVSTPDSSLTLPLTNRSNSRADFFATFISVVDHIPTLTIDIANTLLCTLCVDSPWSRTHPRRQALTASPALYLWSYIRRIAPYLKPTPTLDEALLDKVQDRVDQVLIRLRALLPPTADVGNHLEWDLPTETEIEAGNEVTITSMQRGRCFGVTRAGRYFNGGFRAREGDSIVVFRGSNKLFVIRGDGDSSELIDDVYVDGLMDGEAYEGVDSDDVDYEIRLS